MLRPLLLTAVAFAVPTSLAAAQHLPEWPAPVVSTLTFPSSQWGGYVVARGSARTGSWCVVERAGWVVAGGIIGFGAGAVLTLLTHPDGASTSSQRRTVGLYLVGGAVIGAGYGLLRPGPSPDCSEE